MPYILIVITVLIFEITEMLVFLLSYNRLMLLRRKTFVFVNAMSYASLCFMPVFITLAYAAIYDL